MAYALSLLDKSPITRGETGEDALRRTVALAQRAERLGFRRFWVAEHHGVEELASSSPEVLIAFLLANTRRIRIGSGGVMLQHYSPYKVAENFNLLSSLAPGRVDIGIGKAPGGLPFSARALQEGRDPAQKSSFAQQLADLGKFLDGPVTAGDPLAGLRATPRPPTTAERFLLGASVESAELAASEGWNFVFARHLNGDDALLDAAVAAYRDRTGRPPLVAIAFMIAETAEEAERQKAGLQLFRIHIPGAQSVTVGSEAQAREYARQAGASDYRLEPKAPSILAGTARQVLDGLDALHARSGVEEFVVESSASGDQRLAAVDALAEAHRLRSATPTYRSPVAPLAVPA